MIMNEAASDHAAIAAAAAVAAHYRRLSLPSASGNDLLQQQKQTYLNDYE